MVLLCVRSCRKIVSSAWPGGALYQALRPRPTVCAVTPPTACCEISRSNTPRAAPNPYASNGVCRPACAAPPTCRLCDVQYATRVMRARATFTPSPGRRRRRTSWARPQAAEAAPATPTARGGGGAGGVRWTVARAKVTPRRGWWAGDVSPPWPVA
eukprot:1955655-Prymnesium_polylepis.2